MRIFVGYGYNDRDKWVEDYVFPLLLAFGCEVLHGKAVYGGPLSDEVTKIIRTADAVIGFTTRRELIAEGKYTTHEWVKQELVTAHTQNPPIPWAEIREEGVISSDGILESADAQRIDYRQEDLAVCLIKIAQAVRRFYDLTNITMVRLGPASVVDQISPLLNDLSFACTCQTLRGHIQASRGKAPVFPIKGALFVQLRGVTPGELVQITIAARGRIWRSVYESVDTVDVQVKEE